MRNRNLEIGSYVSAYVRTIRLRRHLSQEKMAELLQISTRCYQALEAGYCGTSGQTISLLLLMLSEEERREFVEGLAKAVQK
ncbi:MAG: hypothetical protein LIO67_01450 [Lachnospiraceae bacterium]|nr:hypothetical protein [Lachnospiraceae bacterium]